MESLSPNVFVRDMRATIHFYEQLGFQLVMTVPETGEAPPQAAGPAAVQSVTVPVWAMMSAGNVTFMFQSYESLGSGLPAVRRENGGSLLFYIKLKGVRALFEKTKDKAPLVHGLQKTFYGATEFSILDNNNYVLTFAEDEVG
jgi:uncharacterized glyoxalase superfamily protein PhnB